ncbi:hypothetical protein ACOMHN_032661 [Nucella lapillus]
MEEGQVDPAFLQFKAEAELLELTGKDLLAYIETQRQRAVEREQRALEIEERKEEQEREERKQKEEQEREERKQKEEQEREERKQKEEQEREERKQKEEQEREDRRQEQEREDRRQEQEREDRRQEQEREDRRQEREREREHQRFEIQDKESQLSHEERENVRQYEVELRRIESEAHFARRELNAPQPINKVKMPFLEDKDDVETYIAQFERVATLNDWPAEEWGTRLAPLLKGDAREAYVQVPIEDSANFQVIKRTLLKRHQLNAITYRKRFRTAKPRDNEEDYVFWDRLSHMIDRWVEMSGKEKTDLGEMLVMERFLETQSVEKARFIREREPNNRHDTIRAADLFEESRMAERRFVNGKMVDRQERPRNPGNELNLQRPSLFRRNEPPTQDKQYFGNRESRPIPMGNFRNKGARPEPVVNRYVRRGPPTFGNNTGKGCYRCGGSHFIKDCKMPERASVLIGEEVYDDTIQAFTRDGDQTRNDDYYCEVSIEGKKAKAMRDTGATQTQVRKELVPDECYTGKSKMVTYANNSQERLPMALVYMETPYFTGRVEVLVANVAPIPILIGNREVRNAQTKEAKEVGKKETLAPVIGEPSTSAGEPSTNAAREPETLNVKQTCLANVTPKELKEAQKGDETLRKPFYQARQGDAGTARSSGANSHYYLRKGTLYRKFTSTVRSLNQVIVPKKYRQGILNIAHDPPMSGHLGVKKTKDRITASFYWPGIDKDVQRHCLSCDACQRCMGKGAIRRAPLQEVPVVSTPFEQVGVDIIGPINPSSSRGHRYVLTMIDYATKYVEATPLERVTTITVAEALLDMWSRLGVPNKVISDRGTQFTSEVMQEVYRLLSIQGATTTPYHAQANGMVEKFNGTLKSMIRKLCIEQPTEWDRYIPAMLFAYREVPQDTTQFSPFELLYGRSVQGPLQILKKCWTDEEENPEIRTTAEYVTNLRNKMEETCKIAAENQCTAKKRYTAYYDKKARHRSLTTEDKVLVLLPDKHKRLQLSWKGPFPVIRKVNQVDYVIRIKGKEKVYHLNLIKKYNERETTQEQISVVIHEEEEEDLKTGTIPLMPLKQMEDAKDIRYAEVLTHVQTKQLQQVVERHKNVFSDLPGKTTLAECEIRVQTETPVRVAQYPLPHSQMKVVKEEIAQMEAMGVIEKSVSPYNAPIVLVKKKDNTVRFCTDYRKLNLATEFDAEPMPDIDGIFSKLSSAKYFSKLDLCKGFWQIPVKKEDRSKTAFSTPEGQYSWKRMPFGLKNASAIFSRMMRKLLSPLEREDVHNFIDDVLIASEDWEEHLKAVDLVLGRLEEEGLTAKPSKCHLGHKELAFLGHEIGNSIIKPESDKVDKLVSASRPTTKKQIRAFLGLAGYYRKFISNFAEIATPLTDATKKGKPEKVEWTEQCETAFMLLKSNLSKKPVVILPNSEQEYVLRTDASDKGIGAVLLQERDGDLRPVAYSSKKLNNAEQNYSTIEKECLGVVWAIKKFEPYLYGSHFILETDHRPLEYLKRAKTDNGRLMRWALQLQQHTFTLRVIPGVENIGADYMSRTEEASVKEKKIKID